LLDSRQSAVLPANDCLQITADDFRKFEYIQMSERRAEVVHAALYVRTALQSRPPEVLLAGRNHGVIHRTRLERLCRYAGRPPVAAERLSFPPDGRLIYRLKRRWRDGTTHVIFEPLELIEKLAALVPAPRFNLV
jgi:hypothetical protein